jgi:hypothetical protein
MGEKVEIPWETKYKFALGGYSGVAKGFMYVIRDELGAAKALEFYEKLVKKDDRVKNLTNTILTAFKLEGNDAETIGKWYDIFFELFGFEYTTPERSKTILRNKVTKCPFKTEPKDISDWCRIYSNMVVKTINPKATFERPKAMCAGDPYCEAVVKIEE